jgi:hypothetical protein
MNPPPPFWRTRHFAFDVLQRRPYLDPLEIRRIWKNAASAELRRATTTPKFLIS